MSEQARNSLYALSAVVALVWVLAARLLGPSDAWDQAQPKTMLYTADIILNDHWALPRSAGGAGATKPPLYNWLAAPVVGAAGLAAEAAHKTPSVIAACLCWLLLLRMGPRLLGGPRALGSLAAMMFLCSYTTFKLAYLARPDMLLTLWLLGGWMAATSLLVDPARGAAKRLALWSCVALAALTKGPAVIPLLIYALIGPRLVTGRWTAWGRLGWAWGLPASMLVFGVWVYAVWRIDPQHVIGQLWGEEIFGRVTGLGPESGTTGPVAFVISLFHMPFYYIARFEPWCIFSILGVVVLWRRDPVSGRRRWREAGRAGAALNGAAGFVIIVLAFYTLSVGKRADYIAAALPPGALLAAWWLLESPSRLGVRAPWLAPGCAALVLGGLTLHNQLQVPAPGRGFGDALVRFALEARSRIEADPAPIVFRYAGETSLQPWLGYLDPWDDERLAAACRAGGPFWLVAGGTAAHVQKRAEAVGCELKLREACRTPAFPRRDWWPIEVALYRAEPAPPSPG